ncbi:hypothetical protein MASSI9I_90627 [Massilia sp. 9I]|nr:hypothetical protein MASSI9I_90627 [Massilia sp. 9I]
MTRPEFDTVSLQTYNAVINSLIAQSVERRTVNPQVPGSSPGRGARILEGHIARCGLFVCPLG